MALKLADRVIMLHHYLILEQLIADPLLHLIRAKHQFQKPAMY
jgi:hypothetical protein